MSNSDNDILILKAPDAPTLTLMHRKAQSINKDSLWSKVKPVLSVIQQSPSKWESDDAKSKDHITSVTTTLMIKKSLARREIIEDFYCYFFGVSANLKSLFRQPLSSRARIIAEKLLDYGAMCLADVPEIMHWRKYEASSWRNNMDRATLDRWETLSETMPLSACSKIVYGFHDTEKKGISNYFYSYETYPFIVPEPILINQLLNIMCPMELDLYEDEVIRQNEGLTYFSGTDFPGNENVVQNLIITGILKPIKTRIGIRALKTIPQYLKLREFPESMVNASMSRSGYIAALSLSIFGEPGNMKIPAKPMPGDDFLKALMDSLKINKFSLLSEIFNGRLKFEIQNFIYGNSSEMSLLHGALYTSLFSAFHRGMQPAWVSINQYIVKVTRYYSELGCAFMMPPNYYGSSMDRVSYADSGRMVDVADYKALIHDRILFSMIEGMAAIGMIDLMVNEDGQIEFVRPSRYFSWYVGLEKERPEPEMLQGIADALEVDQATGMVLLKDKDYPYLSILKEVAEKITDTRYVITEKSLGSGCNSVMALEAKINKFKNFISPKPKEKIARIIKRLKEKCDLVKPTPGGTTYKLFDIDPKEEQLLEFITHNKEIRENSMRVEGCRLLVKNNFIDRFQDLLARAGYPLTR